MNNQIVASNQIITEAYAQSLGGTHFPYTPNLCCTKSRAMALGCVVSELYTDNQLVSEDYIMKPTITQYLLRNKTYEDLTDVKIQAGSCIFTGDLPYKGILYSTGVPSGSSWTILVGGSRPTTQEVYPAPNMDCFEYEYREKK